MSSNISKILFILDCKLPWPLYCLNNDFRYYANVKSTSQEVGWLVGLSPSFCDDFYFREEFENQWKFWTQAFSDLNVADFCFESSKSCAFKSRLNPKKILKCLLPGHILRRASWWRWLRSWKINFSVEFFLWHIVLNLAAVAAWQHILKANNAMMDEISASSMCHNISDFPEPDTWPLPMLLC